MLICSIQERTKKNEPRLFLLVLVCTVFFLAEYLVRRKSIYPDRRRKTLPITAK